MANDLTNHTNHPHRYLIVLAVMLAAVIEVLDMTIVNVSLPHMMGVLGANSQQITWVLTSYIVSAAIFMPLTGFLTNRIGRKNLLLVNIMGFLIASACCGASQTLTEIILFRALQGIFGASLVPLSQQILQSTFTKEEQPKAMAIWGIGIMVAPMLGPSLGGYITESLSWRWVFYVNIPVCIAAFFLSMRYLTDTPHIYQKIDWRGLILMAIGVGSLQIFLDQGNEYNWFESNVILLLAITAALALVSFIIRGIYKKDNLINLRLFHDLNFSASTSLLAIFCISLFSSITILPLLLEQLLNYPTNTVGLVMAPQGAASACAMALTVQLSKKIDPRKMTACGILFAATGAYLMSRLNLNLSEHNIVISTCLMGFGTGLFFVPITALAYNTLAKKDIPEGSGLFSFGRSLGSSIGISIIGTVLSRQMQINWNTLGGHIQFSNPNLQTWLLAHHLSLQTPITPVLLGQLLAQQSTMIAFIDCYKLITLLFLSMLPLLLFIKKPKIPEIRQKQD